MVTLQIPETSPQKLPVSDAEGSLGLCIRNKPRDDSLTHHPHVIRQSRARLGVLRRPKKYGQKEGGAPRSFLLMEVWRHGKFSSIQFSHLVVSDYL